jgi:hypothetical protein
MRTIRCTVAALALGAALAVPGAASAKPMQAFYVGDSPSTFKQNRCARWGTKLNETKNDIDSLRATQKDLDKQISQALDDGCAVIH